MTVMYVDGMKVSIRQDIEVDTGSEGSINSLVLAQAINDFRVKMREIYGVKNIDQVLKPVTIEIRPGPFMIPEGLVNGYYQNNKVVLGWRGTFNLFSLWHELFHHYQAHPKGGNMITDFDHHDKRWAEVNSWTRKFKPKPETRHLDVSDADPIRTQTMTHSAVEPDLDSPPKCIHVE
jgi:hypothetical protein